MHPPGFVQDLALVLSVAAVTGLAARRLGQPPVLGYLLAGLLVGPHVPFPLFADLHRVQELSDFGVVLVMFAVGLEFRLARFVEVLPRSGLTALVQMGLLGWLGVSCAGALGWSTQEGLFLGGCLAISSTMVVTKIFAERPVEARVHQFTMGVLVLQDVVAIGLVAGLSGLAAGGDSSLAAVLAVEGRVAGFLLVTLVAGMLVVPRLVRFAVRSGSDEVVLVAAVGLCFGLAYLAAFLGYSVALGSFVAGVLVAESGEREAIEHLVHPLRDLFGAVFFVSVGMTLDPALAAENLALIALISALVVLGQLGSVTFSAVLSGLPLPQAVSVGLALGQLGEFAFLLAAIGSDAGVLRPEFRPVVVSVAVVTAFTTPLLLARATDLAARLSHALPRWLRTALPVYQAWIERVRHAPAAPRSRLWRVVAALLLDAGGLAAVSLGVLLWLRAPGVQGARTVAAGAGLLAIPLTVGLVRNARAFGALLVELVVRPSEGPDEPESAAAPVVRAAALLGVVLGVGLPAAAVLRPLLSGPFVASATFLLAALLLESLRRRSQGLEAEVLSGTSELLRRLGSESHADRVRRVAATPGSESLGGVLTIPLHAGAHAIGRSLRDMEVRARTGALVLAIRRHGEDLVVPDSQETFREGDVVALLGTREAMLAAARLLDGPRHEGSDPPPIEYASGTEKGGGH